LSRGRAPENVALMKAADFFTLPPSLARFAAHFPADATPWIWLKAISAALTNLETRLPADLPPGVHVRGAVWIDPSVKLPHVCTIIGPAYVGANTEIRPGAFIRGNVIAGAGCVLGNACEFKNALLMDGAQVPHFSYVGDSILGNKAHLGAGVICSNLRSDQQSVSVRLADGTKVDSGLRKFGAIVGDGADVGCNSVLQPGSVLGRNSIVYPLTPFRGTLGENMIAAVRGSGLEARSRG
jgi:NDP-sugar pyrophosphorylase family protein